MALELVGGAALGAVFAQLQKETWRVKDNVAMFKPKLEELEETLDVLSPLIEEIDEQNRRLNRPNHGRETTILRKLLQDGTKLVSRCSKIRRWNFLKQSRYREKLMELDNKILRFHLYMLSHMGRDQKQTLLFAQETRQMLIMFLNEQGFSNITMGITASSSANSSDLTTASSASSSSNTTTSITASTTANSSDLTTASANGSSSNITTSITASSTANSSDLTTASSAGSSSNITMSITASSTANSSDNPPGTSPGSSGNITMSITASSAGSSLNITMSITASSTEDCDDDAYGLRDQQNQNAQSCGCNHWYELLCLEGDGQKRLVVIWKIVDHVLLMKSLRKKVGYAELLLILPQQANTIEDHIPQQRSLTLCLQDN